MDLLRGIAILACVLIGKVLIAGFCMVLDTLPLYPNIIGLAILFGGFWFLQALWRRLFE